jgi:hypothetical protein
MDYDAMMMDEGESLGPSVKIHHVRVARSPDATLISIRVA